MSQTDESRYQHQYIHESGQTNLPNTSFLLYRSFARGFEDNANVKRGNIAYWKFQVARPSDAKFVNFQKKKTCGHFVF